MTLLSVVVKVACPLEMNSLVNGQESYMFQPVYLGVLLLIPFAVGCSYSGKVQEGKYDLSSRVERYEPLEWVVVFDERASTFDPIEGKAGGMTNSEMFPRNLRIETDGFESGVKKAIESMFKSPTPTKSAEMTCDFDLVSTSSSDMASCSLVATFDHAVTGERVFRYEKKILLRGNKSSGMTEAALLGGTLGLSTVLMPVFTASQGSDVKSNLANEITLFLAQIHREISDDRAVFAARIRKGSRAEVTTGAQSEIEDDPAQVSSQDKIFKTPTPRSPYEIFMQGVFVVSTSTGSTGTGFFTVTPS